MRRVALNTAGNATGYQKSPPSRFSFPAVRAARGAGAAKTIAGHRDDLATMSERVDFPGFVDGFYLGPELIEAELARRLKAGSRPPRPGQVPMCARWRHPWVIKK